MTGMRYIKPCPRCKTKLRFPLDRGKIVVKCGCGHSFVADPDDTSLFRDGSFDLGETAKSRRIRFQGMNLDRFMKRLYDYWYLFLNFRYLPADRQRKVLIIVLGTALALALAVFIARGCGSPRGVVI